MSDILSPDEVDALLKGVADGRIPVSGTPAEAPASVRTVDLTQQERSLRGRLPGLELVVDRFVRGLRTSLTTFFGQVPGVSAHGLELIGFASLLERLPEPVGLVLFRLAPLRGQGMIAVTAPLVGTLLQVFFGGDPGRKTPLPAREFSAIELRVIERLALRVLGDLREAWRPLVPLEAGFVRLETNRAFATIAEPKDPVVVLDLAIELEGGGDCPLTLCIPNMALESVRPRLQRLQAAAGDSEPADGAWAERMREALGGVDVELTAELGTKRMSLRAVLNLRAGDLISLPTGREGPVLLRVVGRPRFMGAPGVSGGNNAVRLTARV